MRKNRLISQFLQRFSLGQSKSYDLGNFCFGVEKDSRDYLTRPVFLDTRLDILPLAAERQNLFSNCHRSSQSRRFNPKEVY